MSIRTSWLMVLFSFTIALLIFSLPVLLITKKGMLKSSTTTEDFPFLISILSVFASCILKLYRFSISG